MAILTNLKVPETGDANSLLIMPKLSNRFRVKFEFSNGEFITGNVMTVTRPTLAFDPVQLDAYNSRIYIPGKHTWNPITITLRDDVSNSAVNAIDAQLERQINMATQSVPLAAGAFKFRTVIETLDGTNGTAPGIVDTWSLSGCYVENVEYGNNDYSTADPVQISLTIKYDNALHTTANVAAAVNATGNQG